MKYLITGATGFVGKKLVSRLLVNGHAVSVLTRSPGKIPELFGNAVQSFPWRPESELPPSQAFKEVDAVIHLAGEGIAEKRWSKEQKKKIYDSRVIATRNLVSALNQMGAQAPKTLISTSAIGFFGDRGDEKLTESSSHGRDFLAQVCQDWEVEASKVSDSIRLVCIRVGVVLGREGGALKKLLPLFQTGMGGPVGSGSQYMSWIHVEDLVSLYIECATQTPYRGIVNGVAPTPVTNATFSKALGKALHRPALLPAPAFALKLAMGELSVLVLSSQKVYPEVALKNGFPFQFPEIDLALEDIAKKKELELLKYQWLSKKPEQVFTFFSDEHNLEQLTPSWLNFKVIGKNTQTLQKNSLIDYKLKIHGIPVRWSSLISDWTPNSSFVDEQVKGPYQKWHHTHSFIPSNGGTLMVDQIQYSIPGAPYSTPFLKNLISRDIDRIFQYRRQRINEVFPNV